MAKIQIIPGFTVEPGNGSLRVVTRDFLKSRGYDPDTGFHFTEEMNKKYGGKKLKLHHVAQISVGRNGANFQLWFSKDKKDDSFKWNEFMFKQYWDAIDSATPAPAKRNEEPKPEKVETPKPQCDCEKSAKEKQLEDKINLLAKEVDFLYKENSRIMATLKSLTDKLDKFSKDVTESFESVDNDIENIGERINAFEDVVTKLEDGKKSKASSLTKMLLLSTLLAQKPQVSSEPAANASAEKVDAVPGKE